MKFESDFLNSYLNEFAKKYRNHQATQAADEANEDLMEPWQYGYIFDIWRDKIEAEELLDEGKDI